MNTGTPDRTQHDEGEAMSSQGFYRISWQMVDQQAMKLYSNADPLMYKNTTQTVPNSQIPDEHWHAVSKETSNPWQQYNQLREWDEADHGFVRNVRLERMVSEPVWEAVDVAAKEDTP